MTDAQAAEQAAPFRPGVRAAVTGASGFIGSRLVERLLERGATVMSLARRAGEPTVANHRVLSVDLTSEAALTEALAGVDWVFHCAYDWGDETWNVRALDALAGACLEAGCRRLVHVSSFVVYDVPARGELTEEAIGTLELGGYAHVKRALDERLIEAVRERGLPATIVQPTIVYGPGSKPWTIDPADMLLYGTVILPDQGEGVCNAVYVDDVVDGMILAAQAEAAVGRAFLLSGEPASWGAFYEGLAEQLGVAGPRYWPQEAIRREYGGSRRLWRTLTTPTLIARALARKRPISRAINAAMRPMPARARRWMTEQLFGPFDRVRGHLHIPDPGRLDFLLGRATISSGRARALLDYAPCYSLKEGWAATGAFLDAYKRERVGRSR